MTARDIISENIINKTNKHLQAALGFVNVYVKYYTNKWEALKCIKCHRWWTFRVRWIFLQWLSGCLLISTHIIDASFPFKMYHTKFSNTHISDIWVFILIWVSMRTSFPLALLPYFAHYVWVWFKVTTYAAALECSYHTNRIMLVISAPFVIFSSKRKQSFHW